MLIEAAGKTWVVEEQDLTRILWAGGDRFSGLTFRNLEYASDEVHVRWVMRPDRLTRRLAEELFELAAVRRWRDPREGRLYELRLETNIAPQHSRGAPVPVEVIRFRSDAVSAEAPWTLAKPLGWASDDELITLLERALPEPRSPRLRPS